MAKKLYGTDPDQVPTNADLGTIAYQDSKNTVLENAYVNAKGADGLEMGEDYTSRNNSSRLFFNSTTATGNWSVFNNSGSLVFKSGAAAGSTSGNYTALSLTTSNVTIGGNLVVGNGNGIDFSATSNTGNMSSELLDDYEEGTWTPVYRGSTTAGTATVGSTEGFYTKIGNSVTIWLRIANMTISGAAGATTITGLPYTSSHGSAAYASIAMAMTHNIDFATDRNQSLYVVGTNLNGLESRNGTNWTDWAVTNSTGIYINFTMTYRTT